MVYADHEYYTTDYLGTILSADDFPRLSLRASRFLDYYTQGRAARHPDMEAVKMACCALAEQYQVVESAQELARKGLTVSAESAGSGAELQSQTVGSWTKSYRSGGDSASSALAALEAAKAQLAAVAQQYLAGTGLLYRGRCFRCSHTL